MSRQDRQGVRTPADLEQKYNFERSFAEVKESARAAGTAAQKAQSTAERANEAAREAKTEILKLSDSITLSVTDGEPGHTAMIKLKVGEKEYTGQIDMQGVVTFTSLKTSGSTEINGDNITTGSILADLIKAGVIKSKDGTSVVIDLDEGNVDLIGNLTTEYKTFDGYAQRTSITGNGVTVEHSSGNTYGRLYNGMLQLMADGYKSDGGIEYEHTGVVYDSNGNAVSDITGNIKVKIVPYQRVVQDGDDPNVKVELELYNACDKTTLKALLQSGRVLLTGLTEPENAADAANKEYVDQAKEDALDYAESAGALALADAKSYVDNKNSYPTPRCIEFQPGDSAGHGGYLDFHFNNSSSDYTSRIIEMASGSLTCYGNWTVRGAINATDKITTMQNLLDVGTNPVTTYPTTAGLYRTSGTNIFSNMDSLYKPGVYGMLAIFRSLYSMHLYVDTNADFYWGYKSQTFSEPTSWRRAQRDVLLWTNSSPGSSFAAQTISVSLSSYDLYRIVYRFSTSEAIFQSVTAPTGYSANLTINAQSYNRTGGRIATYSSTGLAFGNANYNGSTSGSNTYCIPCYIYGIKRSG